MKQIPVVLIGLLIASFSISCTSLFGSTWDEMSAVSYLEANIPADATDVEISETLRRFGDLEITFSSSEESALNFASEICGELIEGYDPFDAVASASPGNGFILIKNAYTHYTKSRLDTTNVAGHRCLGSRGHIWHISITPQGQEGKVYIVRFKQYGGCPVSDDTIPCDEIADYINPILNSGFPLMVLGLEEINGQYTANYHEICMETRLNHDISAMHNSFTDNLLPYLGSTMSIIVAGESLPEATITAEGHLVPTEAIDELDTVRSPRWNYCFDVNAESGTHPIRLSVNNQQGINEFSWAFQIE